MARGVRRLPLINEIISIKDWVANHLDFRFRLLRNASRLAAIKRAVAIPSSADKSFAVLRRLFSNDFRYIFKSSSEELMQFLSYHRLDTAKTIEAEYTQYLNDNITNNSNPSNDEQIREFLALVLKHSQDVFEVDVEDYQKNTAAYENDMLSMNEFKKLFSRTCNESGYDSLAYTRHDLSKYQDYKGIAAAYTYNDYNPDVKFAFNKLDKSKYKVDKRFWDNSLFYGLVPLCLLLVIGEGSSPANFALQMLSGVAGLTTLAGGIPLYGIVFSVFLAAASVSYVLFHPDSVKAFKDIFLKGSLHRDKDGNFLPAGQIIANGLRLISACFSALVLALISYKYTLLGQAAVAVGLPLGVGLGFAAIVSFTTFVGFAAVLTNASRAVLSTNTFSSLKQAFSNLLVKPFNDLNRKNSLLQNFGYSVLLMFNAGVLATTGVLAVSVAASTTAMFFDAVLSFGVVGIQGSAVIVGFAQIALVTFFIKNLAGLINLMREGVVGLFAKNEDSLVKLQANPFREQAQRAANYTRKQLIVNAVINTVGFFIGYLNKPITHKYVANVLNLLTFGYFTGRINAASPYLSPVSYGGASIGGNALASWYGLAPIVPMHAKPSSVVPEDSLVGSHTTDDGSISSRSSVVREDSLVSSRTTDDGSISSRLSVMPANLDATLMWPGVVSRQDSDVDVEEEYTATELGEALSPLYR